MNTTTKFDYRYGKQAGKGLITYSDSKLMSVGACGPFEIEDAVAAGLNGCPYREWPKLSPLAWACLNEKASLEGISAKELVFRACQRFNGVA